MEEPGGDPPRDPESALAVPDPDGDGGGSRRRRGHRGQRRTVLLATVAVLVVLSAAVATGLTLTGGSESDDRAGPSPAASSPARGGSGPSAPPTATATLNAADAGLLAVLRPFAVTDCQPAARDGDAVTAALRCAPGLGGQGAPARISIVRYADAAALRADVGRRSAALTDTGDCGRGQTSVERWAHSSRRRGTFLCEATPGRFAITWTVDDELLGFTTEDSDAGRLLAWWRDFDPV